MLIIKIVANKRIFFLYKKPYILFLTICISLLAKSQPSKKVLADPEEIILKLYNQQPEADLPYEDFYESLFQLLQNPLNINTATAEELKNLYVLNDNQIRELQEHIKVNGNLLSLYELQSLPSFPLEIIQTLSSFVEIKSQENTFKGLLSEFSSPSQHYLIVRQTIPLEKAKGFEVQNTEQHYIGDPTNIYIRYRFQKTRKFSFGITGEKDAGEKLRFDQKYNVYGLDYWSFHGMIYNVGIIKRLVIGDFKLQFGQGLVLSNGFYLGKGSETILSVRRASVGLNPYTSLLETGYFRGIASTIALGRIEFTPFISYKCIDASTISKDTLEGEELAMLKATGLHRTNIELNDKSILTEAMIGGNINYTSSSKSFTLGFNGLSIFYSKELHSGNKLFDKFEFTGKKNENYSSYYSYFFKNISLFGEVAIDKNGAKGVIQGVMATLGPKMDISVLYRNYSFKLQLPYGNSFGENFRNTNESGIYWGFKYKFSSKTEFYAYYDLFKFPWLKYRVSAPSEGSEYLLGIKHKLSKKILWFIQFKQERKERDSKLDMNAPVLAFQNRQQVYGQLEWKADKTISLKSRLQGSCYSFEGKNTYGFLISQTVTIEKRRFEVSFNNTLFDTDDFENRQYSFERDVLYSLSLPFFNDKGLRQYVLVRLKITKNIFLDFKYSKTSYFSRNTVGSGWDEIKGNTRTAIRWQLFYRF